MGKDKAMDAMARNQAKWEKKKEKLEKKSEKARVGVRQNEKEQKKILKEQKEEALREERDGRAARGVERKVATARLAAIALLIGSYLGLMVVVLRRGEEPGQNGGPPPLPGEEAPDGEVLAGSSSSWGSVPAALTTLLVVALTGVCIGCEAWKERLIKLEEQKEAASLIKGSLERKQTEKEREERAGERRLQQQKQAKERAQRRAQEEASALLQAKELARALRKRREERQAEEARARAALEKKDEGACDEHGWTALQRQRLRQAVAQYPEGWSHSRKQRWDMIASEVGGGKDARVCESTFARLEEEVRQAAANARDRGDGKEKAQPTSLDDDLDWMTGGVDEDWTTAGEGEGFEDDEDEDEDDDEEACGRERMPVETEPDHRGTEIRLEGIKTMQGCASVQVELLHLQLSCFECRTTASLCLSGADEDAADAKTWCEGCTSLISVRLRPTLVHSGSSRLCYVDCTRCTVTDVLPSVLMSVCASCNADNVHKQEFMRNRILEGACFKCHSKYAFGADAIRVEQVTPCERGSSGSRHSAKASKDDEGDPMDEIAEELRWLRKKAKSDPRQQLIQLGKPLPQMGACRHFKKSYKWYRFACCGRAFPCPECHLDSGCPAAGLGAHASRMICGKCSMEQSYSAARPCEKCGFIMMARGSSHWDDGAGTRNLTAMSTKDAKKFKGGLRQANSKTKTSSGKADRVGAKAKAKREHERKFGKD